MTDYTLAVDGSTYAGSVALIRDRDVISERALAISAIPSRGQRREDFMPMLVDCLASAGVGVTEVSRIVCGSGPGSFTSLRVAASIAKGIAAGAGCPLFSVSSLLLIPAAAELAAGRYVSALPAMRGESFVLDVEVSSEGKVQPRGDVRLVSTASLQDIGATSDGELIGPEVGRKLGPHARGAAKMLDEIVASGACDLQRWEPDYGRLAEAQVKWETAHERPLGVDG